MNRKLFGSLLSVVILMGTAFHAKAQQNTSPYSILGIGDIEKGSMDRSYGMASSGTALYNHQYMMHSNPASYSNLDDHFFSMEMTGRMKIETYAGKALTKNMNYSSDFQIKKFAVAIKITPKWGVSAGLLPFSTQSYSYLESKAVGSTTVPVYYQGTGGINNFYLANGYRINKNWSVGLQASFLFGNLHQSESIESSLTDSALLTQKNIYIRDPYFKAGIQYQAYINKHIKVQWGATGSLKTKLSDQYDLTVSDGSGTVLVNHESYKLSNITIPLIYSTGLALVINDKLTFSGDYNHQAWKDDNISGLSYKLVNSDRYSGGVEFSKKLYSRTQVFEKYFLQAGFYYDKSYVQMYGTQINSIGGTLGFGFTPITAPYLGIHAVLEYGQKGTVSNSLLREKYTQFTITLTYRDFWWGKIKRLY